MCIMDMMIQNWNTESSLIILLLQSHAQLAEEPQNRQNSTASIAPCHNNRHLFSTTILGNKQLLVDPRIGGDYNPLFPDLPNYHPIFIYIICVLWLHITIFDRAGVRLKKSAYNNLVLRYKTCFIKRRHVLRLQLRKSTKLLLTQLMPSLAKSLFINRISFANARS